MGTGDLLISVSYLEVSMNTDRQPIQLAELIVKSIVSYRTIENRVADSLLTIE
jgi:hypothetical protein